MDKKKYAPRQDAEGILTDSEHVYKKYHQQVITDPDYPRLHLAPPVGRLNDPNGLIYDGTTYHAFYQYSPLHPQQAVFWRHATSTDLTHWEDQGTAIAPISWYDKSGCYSGSGFVAPDGRYEFFYTGNVKDAAGNRNTYQALFTSQDQGRTFTRHDDNPFIMQQPAGYTAHFRDPHIVERQGRYLALLGAQRTDKTGAIALYQSTDRRTWGFEGELEFSDPSLRNLGYMYECPNLLTLTDEISGQERDLLIFCPQGMAADGEKYNNIYQCGYVLGRLTGTLFEVEEGFRELDAGHEFYAPQIFHDASPSTTPILMAWFGNAEEDEQPSWAHHWVHMMTYPRELSLRAGRLYQRPVRYLDQILPAQPIRPESPQHHAFDLAGRRQLRLRESVHVAQNPITVTLYDEQGAAACFTMTRDKAHLDRSGARYQAGGAVRTKRLLPADTHDFDILFDGSALEIFIDGGESTFSSRLFLQGEPRRLVVESQERQRQSAI